VSSVPRQVLLGLVGLGVVLVGFGAIGPGDDAEPAPTPTTPTQITVPQTQAPFSVPTFPPGPVRPSIELSRSSGPAGTTLTVSGRGFQGGEAVRIRFSTTELAKVTADGQGAFAPVSVRVPSDFPFKIQVQITATGESSIASTSEPFQVT
ncbi:MAG: IPT/TIG domain-containing protein, partial [Acidimicrobiales bacterium]